METISRLLVLLAAALLMVEATYSSSSKGHHDALEEDIDDAMAYARYMAATEASVPLMRPLLPVKSIYRQHQSHQSSMTDDGSLLLGRRLVHVWSSWTTWSTCSRTCGAGITSRHRTCRKEYARISPGSGIRSSYNQHCVGEPSEYAVCNAHPCSGITSVNSSINNMDDIRLFQCSLYNNRTTHWTPYQLGSNPCELSCTSGQRQSAFGKVLDGTRCTIDPEHPYRDFCINGRCLVAGCDGRVGSSVKRDFCGVCGGKNASCQRLAAVAYPTELLVKARNPQRLTETYGYSPVVRIPKGATHVRITDNSTNYIALMDDSERYFLNGNWIIDWSGRYQSASGGVALRYERSGDAETLVSLTSNPLQHDLIVMVLVREKNSGVFYEYWIPRQQPAAAAVTSSTTLRPIDMYMSDARHRVVTARPTETPRQSTTQRQAAATVSQRRSVVVNNRAAVKALASRRVFEATVTPVPFNLEEFEPQPTAASLVRSPPRSYYRDIFIPTTTSPYSTFTTTTTSRPILAKPKKKAERINQVRQHLGIVHTAKKSDIAATAVHQQEQKKKKKKQCSIDGSCWKTVNGKKHFCLSEFVLRCKVLSYEQLNGETRYEVQVVQSYKNTIPILNREFIWAQPAGPDCPCAFPYLRTGTDYIIMGKTDRMTTSRRNEVRLMLDADSYVRVYNQANADRVLRIRRDEAKYCHKYKTKFNLTY